MGVKHTTGTFHQWVSIVSLLTSFSMVGVARAQAVDLLGLGLNADFENPDQVDGAGETHSTRDVGSGWTFSLLAGASTDFGVQDPADGYYGAHPLPAPFDGRQIGYFNLDAFSVGEIVSIPVGAIVAAQTYTLDVAVGARANDGWANQRYFIGLRTVGGTDLGTFATVDLDPDSTVVPNISDLEYTLDVDAEAGGFVGQDVQIVIRGVNLSTTELQQFTQPNFDNVRLDGTFAAANVPVVTINRQTGGMTLSKSGSTNMSMTGYSLTSDAGSFDSSSWLSVTNNYDKAPQNGSVDSDDAWTILGDTGTGSATDLSEAEVNLTGNDNGGVLSTTPIDLGNSWLQTPFEDVVAHVSLADGSVLDAQVVYGGTAIPTGDLTGDADVTTVDWTAFKSGQGTDFTGLSDAEAYLKGDMDGDHDHDLSDFLAFRTAYETFNGAGSFAAMLASVPEPSTFVMLAFGGLVGGLVLGRRSKRLAARSLVLAVCTVVVVWGLANVASAAYTLDREYQFGDDPDEDSADAIANHNGDVGTGALNVASIDSTLDTMGPGGAHVDLDSHSFDTGGGADIDLPKYIDVSVTSANLAQVRPGASGGNLGILFDGTDDYLSALPLNYPSIAPGTINYAPGGIPTPGPNNYNGIYTQGFQLWVYPDSAGSGTSQHLVMDTLQHGLRINTDDQWVMVYDDGGQRDNNVAVTFDQWSHVMVTMTSTLPATSVLYLNGEAVATDTGNYDFAQADNDYLLTVGAATGNSVATLGGSDYFTGVLDELNMFVWGTTYDADTDTFTDLGQFDFATDNEYAASHLTGVPGDVNQVGGFTQADIDDFVAGFGTENTVNGIRVGDINTILDGDLNFDGITDLVDLGLLRAAIAGAGGGAGFNLTALNGLSVPEPSSVVLATLALLGLVGRRKRRGC